MGVFSDNVSFKGNLLYKEYGSNYLNQESIVLSRRLETADLQIYAQTYQDSSNLYFSFCENLERLYFKTHKHLVPPDKYSQNKTHSMIVSPGKHFISQAAAVCKTLSSRLPEVRSRADDREMIEIFDRLGIEVALANIQFDLKSQTFNWESDMKEVASSNVYQPPYYGGRHKGQWYRADNWRDQNILRDGNDYYITFVRAKDGMAFRLSDADTLRQQHHIVCQSPVPSEQGPTDPAAHAQIQMTMGICNRDKQTILDTTAQAIAQIQMITTLKLDLTNNSASLQSFLPVYQNLNPSRRKRSIPSPRPRPCSHSSHSTKTTTPSPTNQNSSDWLTSFIQTVFSDGLTLFTPSRSFEWLNKPIPTNSSDSFSPMKNPDWVVGFFMDGESGQYPIRMGVLPGVSQVDSGVGDNTSPVTVGPNQYSE